MKQRKYVPKSSAVGMRRALASFAVVTIGVTGLTGASASAAADTSSDRELLEAVISQTGPAAESSGTSVASLMTATQYKQMREFSATIIDELEASPAVDSALDGLRSGDPIVVEESVTEITDEATAVLNDLYAEDDVDQILGGETSTDGYGGFFRVITKVALVYKAAAVAKYGVAYRWLAIYKSKYFWNGGDSSDGILRDEAIANMTAAWAD